MSWFKKLAASRRADGISDIGMYWSIVATRRFGIGLVLRYRSDSTFSQRAESNRIKIVLDGEVLEHYELPRTGEAEPAEKVEKGAYVYQNAYGLWACRRLEPKRVVFERRGRRGGLELLDVNRVNQKVLHLPNWMKAKEIIYDAQKPVYFLTFTWGGCWP